jgi:ankyrin repeat protein/catechol 2,3-dioxygenase-like lactoylglutathione lyase family enzyme
MAELPERTSFEYLKKLAKDRLRELRRLDPNAKLTAAQLAVAREHGFSSWRALKAEIDRRQGGGAAAFFEACEAGDEGSLSDLLAKDPALVRTEKAGANHGGWTGLHTAAQAGRVKAVRLLLAHGADPNAREAGDNTYPLHWAAARKNLEVVRALLDAGGDVHGFGDVHGLDAIGWACVYCEPGEEPWPVANLLVERGARHHVFSSIALGDPDLIRKVVEQDPKALARRMSKFEYGRTPLQFAISLRRYDIVDLLILLGADVEAEDADGNTALVTAIMRGDQEAIRRLHAAGAKAKKGWATSGTRRVGADLRARAAALASSVQKGVPMIRVPDIAKTLEWYVSIGFEEYGRSPEKGPPNFGMLAFGKAELMLMPGKPGTDEARLWFYTDKVDELYGLFKSRQLELAQAALAGRQADGFEFVEDIYDPPYGKRQFSIRDLNGYTLIFFRN